MDASSIPTTAGRPGLPSTRRGRNDPIRPQPAQHPGQRRQHRPIYYTGAGVATGLRGADGDVHYEAHQVPSVRVGSLRRVRSTVVRLRDWDVALRAVADHPRRGQLGHAVIARSALASCVTATVVFAGGEAAENLVGGFGPHEWFVGRRSTHAVIGWRPGGAGLHLHALDQERTYTSDLTDAQWELVEPMLPLIKEPGRVPKHPRRDTVDAILYVVRTGCSWRQLPADFPPFLWNLICQVCPATTEQLSPRGEFIASIRRGGTGSGLGYKPWLTPAPARQAPHIIGGMSGRYSGRADCAKKRCSAAVRSLGFSSAM
jgi:hypothetical protein